MHKIDRSRTNIYGYQTMDFSVPAPIEFGQSDSDFCPQPDSELKATKEILRTAESYFRQQDFETAVTIIEKALPAFDKLFSKNGLLKMSALLMLRDSYLIKHDVLAATDCTYLALMTFEEIIADNSYLNDHQATITPTAFAKPVVRKLKTLRRGKASEALRKQALFATQIWREFCRTGQAQNERG